jgi:3-deoxy-manno-octulosonate cytidylyltransferase (CMP-KDO synthetase)
MICRVAKNVQEVFGVDRTFVVTDSLEIVQELEKSGIRWRLVPDECETGTDRISFLLEEFINCSWIFNVQGDEPALLPNEIYNFVERTSLSEFPVTNAFKLEVNSETIRSRNSIKVILGPQDTLQFASRSIIPCDGEENGAALQVCMYGFRPESLYSFRNSGRSQYSNESRENIEILRFIDLSIPVQMIKTFTNSHPVDVPSDIAIVEEILLSR